MDLKEARYILAISKNKSISKAAEELFISQPSLSKYLKNIEQELNTRLFNRINNQYLPTYLGERYIHYAEKIVNYGDEWQSEFDDITTHDNGRINIAIPIMLDTSIIQPTLTTFHQKYPHVKLNIMEEVNFVAEHTLEDHSIDLTFYNVHDFPRALDYQVLLTEEIVMIVSKDNPLSTLGETKEGFRYPWVNLKLFEKENFILLYPDQNTGGLALKLFAEYNMSPNILLHTRNSAMSISMAIEGLGIAFAPESYYKCMAKNNDSVCLSVGKKRHETSLIAAYMKNRYMPQYVSTYLSIIGEHCRNSLQMDKSVF
jgi:DNA-binding transcriptional LysR family regulator